MRRLTIVTLVMLFAQPCLAFAPAIQRQVLNPAVSHIATNTGFTPAASLGSALKARWNADTASTGTVTSWVDSVSSIVLGNGGTPTKSATSWSGPTSGTKGGITYNGSTDRSFATSFAALPVGTNASEFYVSMQPADLVTRQAAFSYGTNGSGTWRYLEVVSTGLQAGDGANATNISFRSGHTVVGASVFANAAMYSRTNGLPGPSVADAFNTGTTRATVGATAGVTFFFNGVVREVDVTGALTESQRQQLEGYLAWDGNAQTLLPFNHPFRFRRP